MLQAVGIAGAKALGLEKSCTFEELKEGQRVRRTWVRMGPDDARGRESLLRTSEPCQRLWSFPRSRRGLWSVSREDVARLNFTRAAGRVQT